MPGARVGRRVSFNLSFIVHGSLSVTGSHNLMRGESHATYRILSEPGDLESEVIGSRSS